MTTPDWAIRPAWHTDALCATPEADRYARRRGFAHALDMMYAPGALVIHAQRLCDRCPVRDECREAARVNDEHHGVWGGWSSNERARDQQSSRRRRVARCGTLAGWRAHQRAHEAICEDCRAARRRYKAALNESKAN